MLRQRLGTLCACAVLVVAVCSSAYGQKQLRWKFAPGTTLSVEFTQNTQSQIMVNGQPFKTNVELSFEMLWEIESVDGDGVAKMRQSFRRAKVLMNSEASGKVEYDSAANTQPAGAAADLAAAVAPLLKAAFHVSIGPRGDVVDVEVPSETVAHLEAHANGRWKDVISKDGLHKILGQSAAVLPEAAVSPGDTWTQETESKSPLGKLTLTNRFTYDETQPFDGTTAEKVSVNTELQLEPAPKSRLKLKSHAYQGSFLFDAERGRLVLSTLKQEIVSVASYRDQNVEVRLTSTQSMKVTE